MKKIGIITMYYYSYNYGGLLQAYALCKHLEKNGIIAEQISYIPNNDSFHFEDAKGEEKRKFYQKIKSKLNKLLLNFYYQKRYKKTELFRENNIAHSDKVYNDDTIIDVEQKYDIFITGSDQVWNPNCYKEAFLLSFVKNKMKVSYAASLGVKELTYLQEKKYAEDLKDYYAISVREKDAVGLISNVIKDKTVVCTVDPVFLLDSNDWDAICSEKMIEQPYIFCYFLGNGLLERKLAEELSSKINMKIVTMPYLDGSFRKCDRGFGDISIRDAAPQDFVSLIKNAQIVLTDSFHAVAFSCIYSKEFFVFPRSGHEGMISRITTTLDYFNCQYRLCDTHKKRMMDYIQSSLSQEKKVDNERFLRIRRKSIDFLDKVCSDKE